MTVAEAPTNPAATAVPPAPAIEAADRPDAGDVSPAAVAPARPSVGPRASAVRPSPPPPVESRVVRRLVLGLAFLLAAAFLVWTHASWTPLHVGVDQNGYLVGGKEFAATLVPRQTPTVPGRPGQFDPHAFVANMWVAGANDPHSFDPKYPVGLPLLYAVLIWIGGVGTPAAYWLSPVAMTLTLPGVFVVVRRFAGSYGGLLAVLAFATSPLVGTLVNNPNSHAVAVCSATWGMAAVLRWWHEREHGGGRRWAVVGGLLVGFVTTVRYSEGMLVLPLLWAAVVRVRPRGVEGIASSVPPLEGGGGRRGFSVESRDPTPEPPTPPSPSRGDGEERRAPVRLRSRLFDAFCLLAAWAVPVGLLAGYNLLVLGTLTGYDATHESTGFSWSYFFDNWETMLRNLLAGGLLLVLPLAAAGLIGMAWRDWRRAGFLWLWAGPCLLLYTFYYWGPDNTSYLRFVTNTWPALLAAAFWPLRALDLPARRAAGLWRGIGRGVLVVAAAGATAALVFWAVRYEPTKHAVEPLATYFDQPPSAYQRLGGRAAFYGGIVAAAAFAAAVAATRGREAVALGVGVVTLLSVADGAVLSSARLETDGYEARAILATMGGIRDAVPDGAMLVCREENMLHYLQFVTSDRLYTGLSFDRGWVDGRPRAASDDPVLIDPVRGQQLFDALKGFDQKALNEQARAAVKAAMASGRRVFVAEPADAGAMLQAVRQKKEGPVPDFIRRYINRPKDPSLVGRRVAWWTVPQPVKDELRGSTRARRPVRPAFRTTCYQVWEITVG